MEREALIDIILNDLNEMRTLVSTFKGKPLINSAFINLAKTKLNNISEELNLLEAVQNEPAPVKENTESSMTSAARTSTPAEDAEEIAESSKKFASGEASEKPQETQPVEEVKTEVKTEPVAEVKPEPVIEVKTEEVTRVVEETKVITEEPPKETVEKTVEKKNTVLGEQIHTEVKSVNEQIAVKKEGSHFTQIGMPVDDVRKAIGINDRFYYQRELFGGSMELLNQTLDQLNQMDSFESARQFLQSNFKWEEDNEVSQSFIKNIQRRFI